MAILIVQLGDIHFEKNDDPAVSRSAAIGAAISAQIKSETKKIVIAVCGDAAYSGLKSEFKIASEFLVGIEDEILSRNSNVDVVRVIIPGNHDCDFSGDQAAREGLLSLIKAGEKPQPSITSVVLKPLKQYFKFAKEYAGENCISDSNLSLIHI